MLTLPGQDSVTVLGEMAHIVAERTGGPRGASRLSAQERNSYANLILLCNIHHQLVDDQPQTYTIERLQGMKATHEGWVEKTLGPDGGLPEAPAPVTDTLHVSLLPVEVMPRYVYGAPTSLEHEGDIRELLHPAPTGIVTPSIIRDHRLWAFDDLASPASPFRDAVDRTSVERVESKTWWDHPDKSRWFVDLLGRATNKLTGHRGLTLDKAHHRYFFPALAPNTVRTVTFRPMNQREATRQVVWQPIRKATGVGRGYWLHRAVSLRFLRSGDRAWCFSIHPEFHASKNGVVPEDSDLVGRRVTRKFAKMFNYGLLAEIQFWRDFLTQGEPRLILRFGPNPQSLVVGANLMSAKVEWPGLPPERAHDFGNAIYQDDLFSRQEAFALAAGGEDGHDEEEDGHDVE